MKKICTTVLSKVVGYSFTLVIFAQFSPTSHFGHLCGLLLSADNSQKIFSGLLRTMKRKDFNPL